MDTAALDELLAFLACQDGAADDVDAWLFPMDAEGDSDAGIQPSMELSSDCRSQEDDVHSVGSSGSRSDTASHRPEQPHTETHNDRHRRRTRKEEIQALHDQVEQLTTQLNDLKTEAGIDLATPVARVPAASQREMEIAKDVKALCLWEKLAVRQLSQRRVSEKQNRELREAVVMQIRRAKRLQHMLQKRAKEERMAVEGMTARPGNPPLQFLPVADSPLFRSLSSDMDSLYASVDDAMERGGLNAMVRPSRSSGAKRTGAEDWVVEVRSVNVLPFSYKQVEKAVWKQQSGQTVHESPNIATKQFEFPFEHPLGVALQIRITAVCHRHVEQHRTVMIIRSVVEPAPGVQVHQTTRIVVQPGVPSVVGPTTEVVTYQTGAGSDLKATQKMLGDKLDLLSSDFDFGAGIIERAVAMNDDNLENMLLTESIGVF